MNTKQVAPVKTSAPRKILTQEEKVQVREDISKIRESREDKSYKFLEWFDAPPRKERRDYKI